MHFATANNCASVRAAVLNARFHATLIIAPWSRTAADRRCNPATGVRSEGNLNLVLVSVLVFVHLRVKRNWQKCRYAHIACTQALKLSRKFRVTQPGQHFFEYDSELKPRQMGAETKMCPDTKSPLIAVQVRTQSTAHVKILWFIENIFIMIS